MTAKQANEIATKQLLSNTEGEYQLILKKITTAATKGLFAISCDIILPKVKERLVSDGYTIQYYQGDQREPSYYTINWD